MVFLLRLIPSFSTGVRAALEKLTPPVLPELQVLDSAGEWIPQYRPDQNWGGTVDEPSPETLRYHYLSQGARTFVVPYRWFMHLEQADSSLWSFFFKSLFFSASPSLSDNRSLLRFGFIRGEKHPEHNPDGLPIGLSRVPYMELKGFPRQEEGLGVNCAACHTGHLIYSDGDQKREYVLEGAPATIDFYRFQDALTAALSQTVLSSLLPVFDGRFDRLARNVLGSEYSAARKAKMRNELFELINTQQGTSNIFAAALTTVDIHDVTMGFSRTDALNSIGNVLFSDLWGNRKNYHALSAPVNFPFLWTTSWFDWVQYDGSVMNPLVRNVGQAMGANTSINITAPRDQFRFSAAIPLRNMVWMESYLAGTQPSREAGFSGLLAPSWRKTFETLPIDQNKAAHGRKLYTELCQRCHLPPLDDPAIWDEEYFSAISYTENGAAKYSKDRVLKLKIISLEEIGTDPGQANVLARRTVDTAGNVNDSVGQTRPGMGLDTRICGRDPNQVLPGEAYSGYPPADLVSLRVTDGNRLNFGLALGAFVQQSIDAWFAENGLTDHRTIRQMKGGRPNCIQAGIGYKARPLNGVWATAPFLHNGSVASLRDLLCPKNGVRPRYVRLGGFGFDPENIGLIQPAGFQQEAEHLATRNQSYTDEGYFVLDTTRRGNSNRGHEFSDAYDPTSPAHRQRNGIIGPKLSAQQCDAMLEYLKIL